MNDTTIGLLTVLFVALKLTGVIDWSWWWVIAPIWGTFLVIVVLAARCKLAQRDYEELKKDLSS